jgi:hypothetical protein
MSNESLGLPLVLAETPQHRRHRRIIVVLAAQLAVILAAAGAVALIQWALAYHPSARPAAALTSPGNDADAVVAFSPDGKTLRR